DGGVYNKGSINASAREGHATAVSIGDGAVLGRIVNAGTISATILTETGKGAIAVNIEDGADVSSLHNTGNINTTTYGRTGVSTAILDQSNGLTSILNQGDISATLATLDDEDPGSTRAIAIDLSGHDASAGVTLVQSYQTPTRDVNGDGDIDTDDVRTPSISGAVLLGAGNDTVDIRAGSLTGSVEMGAGADTFLLQKTEINADINFGAGADIFTLTDGATFRGVLADTDQSLAISVTDSYLAVENETSLVIDTLNVTGDSTIEINIDLQSDDLDNPRIVAQTSAFIDSETTALYAAVDNFNNGEYSIVLLQSPDLTFTGDASAGIDVETPAIFLTDIEATDTELSLVIRPKTAGDLGLTMAESAAYEAILSLATENGDVGDALTSYFEEGELVEDYRSLMPVRHEPATRILASANSLATGPLAQRLDLLAYQSVSEGLGYWAQLDAGYVKHDGTEELAGYKGPLVSFHGGVDRTFAPGLNIGLSGAFMTADGNNDETHEKQAETTAIQFGPYAAWRIGPMTLSAAGAYGFAQINTQRAVNFGDTIESLTGDRKGNYIAGSARATFEARTGSFYIRPAASIDYLTLDQKSYTEVSNATDSPYAYMIEGTTTDRLAASGIVNFGTRSGDFTRNTQNNVSSFGSLGGFTYQRVGFKNIYAGYRTELSSTPYETIATIVETGDSFVISDPSSYDSALLFGASLGFSDDGLAISISYDGEMTDDDMIHRAGLNFRMKF
ncbi:MAG: autotransporter domain-containing protein, partial [Oricola sp.]|nr:autotransporter domain-containing protein [Oricola sp.]